MQINKSKKRSSKQLSSTLLDNDFSSGFEDSKFEKFKPAIKALMVIILLIGSVGGAVAYFSATDEKNDINKNYMSDTAQKAEDTSSDHQDTESVKADPDSDTQRSEDPTPPINSQQPSSSNPSTATKPYDPSRCEPLNNEATRLREAADQKKITFDSTFAARKNYGDIYSEVRKEYGNSSTMYEAVKAESDRRYNIQESQINQLQAEWQDALNKGNAAYSKHQECRAKL